MKTNNNVFSITSFLFCLLFAVSWSDIPPEIQKCKSTDNDECVKKTSEKIFQLYPNGNADFGMPSVSAFHTTNLKVSRSNPDSPIQINFEFINCTVYGLEKSKFVKTAGFDKEMKNVEIVMFTPHVKMQGDYEMNGKMLLLPINGKGKGEVNLKDCDFVIRAKMEQLMTHNNKTYLKVKRMKTSVTPKLVTVNFENLFNGNAVLSKTINDVINENWKDVWTELKDGINHALAVVAETISNSVLEALPIEDMYSD